MSLVFEEAVEQCVRRDDRYAADAYLFVRQALDFTVGTHAGTSPSRPHHVTGPELLEGFRKLALHEFGPMALRILNTWGIRTTEDVGEIVFNLVDIGALGKTEKDRREDFGGGYEFETVFAAPFRPRARKFPPARRNKPPKGERQ